MRRLVPRRDGLLQTPVTDTGTVSTPLCTVDVLRPVCKLASVGASPYHTIVNTVPVTASGAL